MSGERNFTRIPPDSTGKRVRLKHTAQISYTGKTPSDYNWVIGERYTLATSGWTVHVHGVYESGTSGILEVHYSKSAQYENLNPTVGEDIQDSDGVVRGVVSTSVDVWINSNNIIGYDNPENGLDIDNFGAANVRFAEGNPQLDAFGKLRTSGATLLGDYVFNTGTLPSQFSNTISQTGASITWNANYRAAVLTVDGNSADEVITQTSNTYHTYFPGSSHTFMGTLALGDTGATNLIRAWGMFEARNGFLFKQVDGNLYATVRSDVTGSVVDTNIAQADWNIDPLDGTGRSQMTLDVTKDNLYWIDVQWLGAGRTRFGVFYNGQRIVCHEYYHGNNYVPPVTGTGSLPICFVQKANGVAIGSAHSMNVYCAAVYTESEIEPIDYGIPGRNSAPTVTIPSTATTDDDFIATVMRPAATYAAGGTNRAIYFPTEIAVCAHDSVTVEDVHVKVELYVEPIIGSNSVTPYQWQRTGPASSVEELVDPTDVTFYEFNPGRGGEIYVGYGKGSFNLDLSEIYTQMSNSAVKNYAENGGQHRSSITAITKASPAVITVEDNSTRSVPTDNQYHIFREGYPLTIVENTSGSITAMTGIEGQVVYSKITGSNTAELYTDAGFTTPYDTSSEVGTYVAGSADLWGNFGSEFLWAIVVHRIGPASAYTNATGVHVDVKWKELRG